MAASIPAAGSSSQLSPTSNPMTTITDVQNDSMTTPSQPVNGRWQCPRCDKSFTRRGHLKRHEENHTQSKKFFCELCNKHFARSDVLVRHRAVHQQGTRPNNDNSRSEAALKRAPRACKQCSAIKMKCDGGQPCSRCRSKPDGGQACSYRPGQAVNSNNAIVDRDQIQDHSMDTSSSFPVASTSSLQSPLSMPAPPRFFPDAVGLDGNSRSRMFGQPPPPAPASSSSPYGTTSATLLPMYAPPAAVQESGPGPFASDPMYLPASSDFMMRNESSSANVGSWMGGDGIFDWLFAAQSFPSPWSTGSASNNEFAPTSGLPDYGSSSSDTHHQPQLQQQQQQQLPQQPMHQFQSTGNTMQSSSHDQYGHSNGQPSATPRQSIAPSATAQWPNGVPVPTDESDTAKIKPVQLGDPAREVLAFEDTCQVKPLERLAKSRLVELIPVAELPAGRSEAVEDCLQGIPPRTFNLFLQLYFEHFDHIFPILHRPTFDPDTCHPMLLAAVVSIGAMYSLIPQSAQFGEMLMKIVNRAIFNVLPNDNNPRRDVGYQQALLLNFNFFRSSGKQRMMELAESARSPLTTMARKSRLFDRGQPSRHHHHHHHHSARQSVQPSSSGHATPEASSEPTQWLDWVREETGRRTAWFYFISDMELSAVWKLPPSFALDELKAELPQDDNTWRAASASSWARLRSRAMPVYLSELHNALRSGSGPVVKRKLDEVCASSIQRNVLAYSLCSLGMSLWSLESSCLSTVISQAMEDFTRVCSGYLSAIAMGSPRTNTSHSNVSSWQDGSSSATATSELILRFVLLRNCIDISDIQLLAGRSGRREDMQKSFREIRDHLLLRPQRLWGALLHAGRIVHLSSCHAIDSMYESCFLFYAATTLFLCSKIWPEFIATATGGRAIGTNSTTAQSEFITVRVDGEQPVSPDEEAWITWAMSSMSSSNSSSTNPASSSTTTSPQNQFTHTTTAGGGVGGKVIVPTLGSVGDITRNHVPGQILRQYSDHLLSRPRTTWPIGKLLGRIMGEMAAVFGP